MKSHCIHMFLKKPFRKLIFLTFRVCQPKKNLCQTSQVQHQYIDKRLLGRDILQLFICCCKLRWVAKKKVFVFVKKSMSTCLTGANLSLLSLRIGSSTRKHLYNFKPSLRHCSFVHWMSMNSIPHMFSHLYWLRTVCSTKKMPSLPLLLVR